jgi:hypothetical protein
LQYHIYLIFIYGAFEFIKHNRNEFISTAKLQHYCETKKVFTRKKIKMDFLYVLLLFDLLFLVVFWLFSGCFLVVFWLFSGCFLVVFWLFSGCFLVVFRQRYCFFTTGKEKMPANGSMAMRLQANKSQFKMCS